MTVYHPRLLVLAPIFVAGGVACIVGGVYVSDYLYAGGILFWLAFWAVLIALDDPDQPEIT